VARVLAEEGKKGGLVLVGYDTRFMAGRFAGEAARLLEAEGFQAEMSARPVPTPVLSFETRRRGAAAAVNFTASHNPPRYLGIEFFTAGGAPALPEITRRVEDRIGPLTQVAEPPSRPVATFDPVPAYLSHLASRVRREDVGRGGDPPPRFSLDFRFGTSSGFLDAFLEGTGADLSRLNAKADPLFGGESPQCGEKELVRLGEDVRSKGSRLGLSCDGDADRFGVCDAHGAYVQPDQILALLLWDLLSRKGRRGGVARSVATTHALDAIAARFGVPLYETPVGSKYIGEKLIAGEIIFGAEESAGLTIEGHVPERDGILADLLVAEMAGAAGKTLDQLSEDLRGQIGPYFSIRLDLPVSPEEGRALKALRASPPERFAGRGVASVNRLDGMKLLLDDGSWILVRESGTEPLARVYAEAKSQDEAAALARAATELLRP
jgi:phosphoglucomutase